MQKIKIILTILMASLVMSCGAPKKFLGSEQPVYSLYACKHNTMPCTVSWEKDDWTLNGNYALSRTSNGHLTLKGKMNLDVSKVSPALQKIDKLWLTFVLFQGDLIVYEERISLKGKSNSNIEFTRILETDVEFDASSFLSTSWRVKGLEAL